MLKREIDEDNPSEEKFCPNYYCLLGAWECDVDRWGSCEVDAKRILLFIYLFVLLFFLLFLWLALGIDKYDEVWCEV